MTDIKDLINPYVWTAPEYNTAVLDSLVGKLTRI